MEIYVHGGFMAAGLLLMVSGFAVARFLRARRDWLRLHRVLGVAGASSVVLGFIAALYMVSVYGGQHFAVLHAYVGAIAIFMSVLTPALGKLQFVPRSGAAEIRSWHRRSGAVTLILVSLTILSGMVMVGVLPMPAPF